MISLAAQRPQRIHVSIGFSWMNCAKNPPTNASPAPFVSTISSLDTLMTGVSWIWPFWADRLPDVKRAFDDAYILLSTVVASSGNVANNYIESSILGRIVNIPNSIIEYRDWIRTNFKHSLVIEERTHPSWAWKFHLNDLHIHCIKSWRNWKFLNLKKR